MAIYRVCDVCGKEPALDLTRHLPVMFSGKRLLIGFRADVDEGESEPRRIDIGMACLKLAVVSMIVTEG